VRVDDGQRWSRSRRRSVGLGTGGRSGGGRVAAGAGGRCPGGGPAGGGRRGGGREGRRWPHGGTAAARARGTQACRARSRAPSAGSPVLGRGWWPGRWRRCRSGRGLTPVAPCYPTLVRWPSGAAPGASVAWILSAPKLPLHWPRQVESTRAGGVARAAVGRRRSATGHLEGGTAMTTRGGGEPDPWDGCIRALLYPVQFERDPLDAIHP